MAYQMVTRLEKEQLAVQLHKEGKGTREIAKKVHMNLTDIGSILHREFSEEYAEKTPVASIETRALQLFSEGKTLVEVAIMLDANSDDVIEYYKNYLRLNHMHSIVKMLDLNKDKLRLFLGLLREVKRSGLGLRGAISAFRNKNELVANKKELESVNLQVAYKRNELAAVELARIPDVNNILYGSPNFSHRRYRI